MCWPSGSTRSRPADRRSARRRGGRVIAGLTAIGAAEGLRARMGLRAWPMAAAQIALLGRLADSYDDPDAQAARESGRHLTPDEALAVVTASR